MQIKELDFGVTAEQFYRALTSATEQLRSEQDTTFVWFTSKKPHSVPAWEITKNVIPIRTVRPRPGAAIGVMQTLALKTEKGHFLGLKGLETSGFFGLRHHDGKSILFVDASDKQWRALFETIFQGACSRLEPLPRPEPATDIPPEPGPNASREEWFRCYHERHRIGKGRFTHKYMASKIGLSAGKTREYYALWKHEHVGDNPTGKQSE